jgi:CRISPR-associated endonuclease/helicase Cas3
MDLIKGRVVLEHHSSLTPEKETQLNKILSENWDAPIVLTTMVQFLEALFGGGTRSSRRMHQLINSVIIFDEIQSMPIQCVHLFNVAIRFLIYNCKSTVMLCTATQPLLHQVTPRTRALPYDPHKVVSIDTTSVKDALSRADIIDLTTQDPLSFSQAAVLASEQLNLSDSVLMIVNTKKAAYEIFNHLPNDPNVQKYHLSTNMCPAHRLEVIQRVRTDFPHP